MQETNCKPSTSFTKTSKFELAAAAAAAAVVHFDPDSKHSL
jgi:hypothetical protein